MIVAVIALVLALTGGAIAAKKLSLGALSTGAKNKTVGVGKLTYVNTTTSINPPELPRAVSASCPSGLKVIGGGIKVPSPEPLNDEVFISDSYPTTTGWAGHVINYAADPVTATTTAICANSRAVTGTPPSP
jgi:hypothetical protein